MSGKWHKGGKLVPSEAQLLVHLSGLVVKFILSTDVGSTVRDTEHVHVHEMRDRILEGLPSSVL